MERLISGKPPSSPLPKKTCRAKCLSQSIVEAHEIREIHEILQFVVNTTVVESTIEMITYNYSG